MSLGTAIIDSLVIITNKHTVISYIRHTWIRYKVVYR